MERGGDLFAHRGKAPLVGNHLVQIVGCCCGSGTCVLVLLIQNKEIKGESTNS